MDRLFRLLLPILIIVEIVLVWSGRLSIGRAVLIVVAIEVALVLVAARNTVVGSRRFRASRGAGNDGWEAAEDALTVFLPRPVARFIVLEPRMWWCLVRWAFRRYRPGPNEFSYHSRSPVGMFLVLLIFTTPVEILLLELLIPWAWLRWVVLFLALYGLVWMFGFYASLVTVRHTVEPDGIRLRYGFLNELFVTFSALKHIRVHSAKAPDGGEGLRFEPESDIAYFGIGGRTDVVLELAEPHRYRTLTGESRPFTTLHVAVDDPQGFVEAVKAQLIAPSLVPTAMVD